MGYTTDFSGQITITPALNADEIAYLNKFSETRRMHRSNGPYFVEGNGEFGQYNDPDIINHNSPDPSQPGLWCNWVSSEDGTVLEWNGAEKFYYSEEWMTYIIDHFLKSGALAKEKLPFLQANHICNGKIKAQGEDIDDRWQLIVTDNFVSRSDLE